jgi:predicted anti-sigma-YlaC factor YlaD
MNCKSVQIYLSAYLDGELCGHECLQIREHLCGCRECREEELQLRSLKSMLRGLPTYAPTEGFEDRLVANVISRAERRSMLPWNLDWRVASGLAVAAAVAAFTLFQITERRMPDGTHTETPVAKLNGIELDLAQDQWFMSSNDPLNGNRFPIPVAHDKD